MSIRPAASGDRAALYALYRACFPEDGAFADRLFDTLYDQTDILLLADGCCADAMVWLPRLFLSDGSAAGYIYALCTAPDRRGHGAMHRLLDAAAAHSAARGDCFTLLIPADDALCQTYMRYGYAPAVHRLTGQLHGAAGQASDMPVMRRANAADDAWIDAVYRASQPPAAHFPLRQTGVYSYASLRALYGGGFYLCNDGYVFAETAPHPLIREVGVAPGGSAAAVCTAFCALCGVSSAAAALPAQDPAAALLTQSTPYILAKGPVPERFSANLLFD